MEVQETKEAINQVFPGNKNLSVKRAESREDGEKPVDTKEENDLLLLHYLEA